jgi:hypothetical protein
VAASTAVLCQSLVLTSSIQSLQKFEAKFDFLFKKFLSKVHRTCPLLGVKRTLIDVGPT